MCIHIKCIYKYTYGSMMVKDQKIPQFALIKQFLEQQIKSGQWPPGTRIPTEQALTQTFSVSRDRKSTRLNSSHSQQSRMPSSA